MGNLDPFFSGNGHPCILVDREQPITENGSRRRVHCGVLISFYSNGGTLYFDVSVARAGRMGCNFCDRIRGAGVRGTRGFKNFYGFHADICDGAPSGHRLCKPGDSVPSAKDTRVCVVLKEFSEGKMGRIPEDVMLRARYARGGTATTCEQSQ